MIASACHIKIGDISFNGVHELEVNKSMFSFRQTGFIKLPGRLNLHSRNNRRKPRMFETYTVFKEGDPVTIKIDWGWGFNEEFKGFVRFVDQSIPVKIELEGYSYQLDSGDRLITRNWEKTSLKEVLQEVVKGTDVTLATSPDIDVEIVNFNVQRATPAEVLEALIKDVSKDTLTAFFVEPNKLWVGLRFTAYTGEVKFRFGRNVVADNRLRVKVKSKRDVNIIHEYRENDGKKVRSKSDSAAKKVATTHIKDESFLKSMDGIAEENENYEGLDGELTAFIEPYTAPGYKAIISDDLYDRSGEYLVEWTKVKYGVRSDYRTIGIGLKVSE